MTVSVEECILESEIRRAISTQSVGDFTVTDTGNGFYVQVEMQYRKKKQFWLSTRRSQSMPRLFKDLGRLNDHLHSIAPDSQIRIVRPGAKKMAQAS